jgi:hypothetical protein
LTESKDEKPGKHFFDVERYKKVHAGTRKRRGRLGRVSNRITWVLGSGVSLLTGILFPISVIGLLVAIPLIVRYGGGLAFYATVAAFFVTVGIFGEKRVSAAQFTENSFWKRILAQLIAYSFIAGMFFLLFYYSRAYLHLL